jgi:hypothetical protein
MTSIRPKIINAKLFEKILHVNIEDSQQKYIDHYPVRKFPVLAAQEISVPNLDLGVQAQKHRVQAQRHRVQAQRHRAQQHRHRVQCTATHREIESNMALIKE